MESVVCSIATAIVAVLFLGFIAWRESRHQILIDALTSKIMAKDYVQYATLRKEEVKVPRDEAPKEKKKEVFDPVLGRVF